jgi:hypothetical protein
MCVNLASPDARLREGATFFTLIIGPIGSPIRAASTAVRGLTDSAITLTFCPTFSWAFFWVEVWLRRFVQSLLFPPVLQKQNALFGTRSNSSLQLHWCDKQQNERAVWGLCPILTVQFRLRQRLPIWMSTQFLPHADCGCWRWCLSYHAQKRTKSNQLTREEEEANNTASITCFQGLLAACNDVLNQLIG